VHARAREGRGTWGETCITKRDSNCNVRTRNAIIMRTRPRSRRDARRARRERRRQTKRHEHVRERYRACHAREAPLPRCYYAEINSRPEGPPREISRLGQPEAAHEISRQSFNGRAESAQVRAARFSRALTSLCTHFPSFLGKLSRSVTAQMISIPEKNAEPS
jgi:hypothetical protein